MRALLTRHTPESLVCFGAGGSRDAGQLSAYARTIAHALPAAPASLRGSPRVVIACTDRYRFCAALAATWLRGYIAELPVNGQPASVHEAAEGALVVSLLHDRDEHTGLDVRTLEDASATGPLPLALALADDAPALVAFTSGSTGTPTPHEKTLRQLLAEPEAHLAGFSLTGARIVAAVPPYHIYGLLFGVLVPLLGGGSMARTAPLQPAELLRELREASADVLIAVPPHLAAMAAFEGDPWPSLRAVFSSAAPLPAATSEALAARGWPVTEILGSTETGGIASRTGSQQAWRALPSVRFDIADDGALRVDSPWLVPGSERPLRTADRVEAAPDGGFRHLGRSDAVVKIGGRRIDLGELETRLKQAAGVRDARVLAVESERVRGLELLAVVEGEGLSSSELRRVLSQHVDPVAVPRRYRLVSRMPRSETGKLSRAALLALFDQRDFPRTALDDGRVRFLVPADSVFFRGHFDGLPVLPGVVQLQALALTEARRRFPPLRVLERVSRIKFKRAISPGETVELSLQRKGPLAVSFSLDAGGEHAASGTLHFRAGDSG